MQTPRMPALASRPGSLRARLSLGRGEQQQSRDATRRCEEESKMRYSTRHQWRWCGPALGESQRAEIFFLTLHARAVLTQAGSATSQTLRASP